MASLFSNAKIAAICAPILHFSALMPRYTSTHFTNKCYNIILFDQMSTCEFRSRIGRNRLITAVLLPDFQRAPAVCSCSSSSTPLQCDHTPRQGETKVIQGKRMHKTAQKTYFCIHQYRCSGSLTASLSLYQTQALQRAPSTGHAVMLAPPLDKDCQSGGGLVSSRIYVFTNARHFALCRASLPATHQTLH